MNKSKKTLLGTFEQNIHLSLSGNTLNQVLPLLNLHHFNDKECNHYVDGKLVSKYPSLETKEVKEAFWRIHAGTIVTVIIKVYSDGSYEMERKN